MIECAILMLPNPIVSGAVGIYEILSLANQEHGHDVFSPMHLAAVKKGTVASFAGLSICAETVYDELHPDLVIIPPVCSPAAELVKDRKLIGWIRDCYDRGTIIATCCVGVYLLAEAGLLKEKQATTHWMLTNDFQEKYPDVELLSQKMLVDAGQHICAAGVMAWQDMALHLVSRFMGPDIASSCSKKLVLDGTRLVQTPYFMFDQGQEEDSQDKEIEAVRRWMQEHYARQIVLEELAVYAKMGVRTFLRRFVKATGETPFGYLRQLRIEAARHLLEMSEQNIDEITRMVGYENTNSFGRLFKKKTGLTPKEYRTKFSRVLAP